MPATHAGSSDDCNAVLYYINVNCMYTLQFGLICGKSFLVQLASSGFFVGYLIGSGFFGSLSDSKGRKPVLFGCTVLAAVATVLVGVSPNYIAYFLFRLLTGIGAAGQALTIYIVATESVGPARRGFAGVATQLFFIGKRPCMALRQLCAPLPAASPAAVRSCW